MSSTGMPIVMSSRKCGPLTGEAHVPGDKSISHRALILGALAVGETKVRDAIRARPVFEFMFTTFRDGVDVSFRHAIV